MKKLHIFKSGKHTDSGGTTLDFNEGSLQSAVDAYNPELYEAPIVVGHPKDNHPAYGWIKSLSYSDGGLFAEPQQVNADFKEMVDSGAFKKISASFYLPDSPANPSPGNLYLRHVGFLGAQPPAIKGLQAPEFNEGEEGILSFEELFEDGWTLSSISSVFRGLKNLLIEKFGKDEAEAALPEYAIDELKSSADRKFNKPQSNFSEDPDMDLEQAKQKIADLEADNQTLTDKVESQGNEITTLQGKVASFEEEKAVAAAAARKVEIETKIDALVKAGNIKPADKEQHLAFAEAADAAGQTVSFGEGDDKQELKGAEAYLAMLGKQKAVDFNEHSKDNGADNKDLGSDELARKAVAYQEEQRAQGNHVDIVTAVNHVSNQQAE